MKKVLLLDISLRVKFLVKWLKNINSLLLKYSYNILFIFLPFSYFIKKTFNGFFFLFTNYYFFTSILSQLRNFYTSIIKFFFFKLRLRGLGYRIKRLSKKLFRFFFGIHHFFYFHVSTDLIVKKKKRYLLVFSNKLFKLNNVFNHLILLKKLDLKSNFKPLLKRLTEVVPP